MSKLRLFVLICAVIAMVTSIVSAEPVKIRLMTNHSTSNRHGQLLVEYIREYERLHPNIEIEFQSFTPDTMLDRILVGAAAGTMPDIVHIAGYMLGELAEARVLAPLPEAIVDEISQSYLPGALGTVTYNDHIWGYPTEYMPRALVYNRNMFDAAGLPSAAPETWADLREYSAKLTERNADGSNTRTGFGLSYSSGGQAGYGMLFSLGYPMGARLLSADNRTAALNSPEVAETLNFLREMVNGGYALAREWLILDMRAAELAMMVASGPFWKLEFLAVGQDFYEGMSTGPIPVPEAGMTHAAAAYGWLFSVTETAQHLDETYAFLNWLNTASLDDGRTRMGNVLAHLGSIPVTAEDLRYQETIRDPFMSGFVAAVANDWTFSDPVAPNTTAILRALEAAMRSATLGTESPVNALIQAEREVQRLLNLGYGQ